MPAKTAGSTHGAGSVNRLCYGIEIRQTSGLIGLRILWWTGTAVPLRCDFGQSTGTVPRELRLPGRATRQQNTRENARATAPASDLFYASPHLLRFHLLMRLCSTITAANSLFGSRHTYHRLLQYSLYIIKEDYDPVSNDTCSQGKGTGVCLPVQRGLDVGRADRWRWQLLRKAEKHRGLASELPVIQRVITCEGLFSISETSMAVRDNL